MAFDMGFDFRSTAGFVTDPAYGVPVLGEVYPHTYTNGNGQSINAGGPGGLSGVDADAANDVRIAGINYNGSAGPIQFQVDLSSGSAPGAGTYTIDLAAGYALGGQAYDTVNVKDNTTTLLSFSGTTGGSNHYFDATGTDQSPGHGSWGGTTVSGAFATTTCYFNTGNTGISAMAHFRLTLTGGGAGSIARAGSLTLLGVGA